MRGSLSASFGPRRRVIQGQEQEKRQHIAITEFSKYIPMNKYVESEMLE
jgi:hypothetical protein